MASRNVMKYLQSLIITYKIQQTQQFHWLHFATTVVSRKRAHGRYMLLCAQTGGWADICNIAAFYHEKAPMFTSSQDIAHQHTRPVQA